MAPVQLDEVYQSVTESIEYAEAAMTKTRTSVEKAQASKENRNKVVSKASEMVNALLEPASQVVNLLDGIGGLFPPCKFASNILAALIKLEVDRRDNDVRIALLYLDFATALANLGTLKPGFQAVTTLTRPLELLLSRFTGLMKEFGQFCEAYYEAKALKSKLKHLLFSKNNSDSLQGFSSRLLALKNDLISLLTQQAVLALSTQANTLSRIEASFAKNRAFYATILDGDEDSARTFVSSHGGEEAVQRDDHLLEQLAQTVGETLTPAIIRAVKEGAEETFKQSQASFMLKLQFALEQRIDESQEMILKELKSGPYELIHDPDVKDIWKNAAAKESNVKRRQLIDGMNYYFNIQFKKYKADHQRAEREDAWTRGIISKVHFHHAIGDAIDDDASGYISIEEINGFMRRKPEKWTVPQWIAYWAYGWDADNQLYRDRILKTYTQLEKLRDAGGPQATLVASYLSETQDHITVFVQSLYNMRELDPFAEMKMARLREELRTRDENELKTRLKSVNHKIDYSVLAAVTGSERVEGTFLPLALLLISRHLWLMGKPNVSSEVVEEASSSVMVLVEAMRGRIADLKMIWRRQRIDVDTQIRYYANGLLEDYYKKFRKEVFDTDVEDSEQSEWNSSDEWSSEDGVDGEHIEGNANTSNVADQNQAPTSRSIPAGVYAPPPQQMGPPLGNNYNREGYGPTISRSILAGGYDSVPQQMGPPRGNNYNRRGSGPATRSIPAGGYDPVPQPQQMGPPHGSNYNLPRSRGLGQNQQYPDSTAYHGALGHGGYTDVAYDCGENGEEGEVGGFEGHVDQPEEDAEEAQEQEPDPEAYDEEQENPGGEPGEDGEEEGQDFNPQDEEDNEGDGQVEEEDYEGDGQVEEEEKEGEGGYEEQAPSRQRWKSRLVKAGKFASDTFERMSAR